MAITSESVREIFKGLENGDGSAFFERVADDVDWIVMGTHPLPVTTVARKLSGRVPSPSWARFYKTARSSM
jgi:uncharacterized protein